MRAFVVGVLAVVAPATAPALTSAASLSRHQAEAAIQRAINQRDPSQSAVGFECRHLGRSSFDCQFLLFTNGSGRLCGASAIVTAKQYGPRVRLFLC